MFKYTHYIQTYKWGMQILRHNILRNLAVQVDKQMNVWMNIAYFQLLNSAGFQAKHESWECNILLWKHWINQQREESFFKNIDSVIMLQVGQGVLPVFENQQNNDNQRTTNPEIKQRFLSNTVSSHLILRNQKKLL